MFVRNYLIPRLLQYFLVIFLGVTIVFVIPRLALPTLWSAPLRKSGPGDLLRPAHIQDMVDALTEMYGLSGSWFSSIRTFG